MLENILCIDDDPIAIMLCKKVITRFEFAKEIIVAQNGSEALDQLGVITNNNTPNNINLGLIFLDLNMPVMGGWEFLENYHTSQYDTVNNTPVVILSSTIDPSDIARAKKYPVVLDFLSKPITSEMLDYLNSKINSLNQLKEQ